MAPFPRKSEAPDCKKSGVSCKNFSCETKNITRKLQLIISLLSSHILPVDGSYTQEMKEQGEEKLDVLVPHLDSNRSAVQKYLGGS